MINNFNNNFREKLTDELYNNLASMEAGLWDDVFDDIINVFETEILDSELTHNRWKLNLFSSPEEYWIIQGKIYLLKELKEKLHNNNNIEEKEK